MLQNISVSNKYNYLELFIKESLKKKKIKYITNPQKY